MRRETNHNLLIWLLALLVVFAPMRGVVAAIDMFGHDNNGHHHCRMHMADKGATQADCCRDHGTCKHHCANCNQCVSVHVALLSGSDLAVQPLSHFIPVRLSSSKGISGRREYRPPRFFS